MGFLDKVKSKVMPSDEERLSKANEAINRNSNDVDAWKSKAAALARLGRDDEALDAYDLIIQAYDGHSHDNEANAYMKSLMLEDQGKILSKQSNPSAAQDKYEEALECIDEAISLNPQHGQFWHTKSKILQLLGRKSEANKAMQIALDLGKQKL